MGAFDLLQFAASQSLAQSAARDCLRAIAGVRASKDIVSVALSGGRIAREFCSTLASQIRTERVSLDGVHFFWSDERCVPPNDPESNFKLANETLLAPLGVPPEQIHRLRGEIDPGRAVAS